MSLVRNFLIWAAVTVVATLPACAQVVAQSRSYTVVAQGQRIKLDTLGALDPSCHSLGNTQVTLLSAPRGGQVELLRAPDYPTYVQGNPRFPCDRHRVLSTLVFYHAAQGFTGPDTFTVEVVFPTGNANKKRYVVNVR